MAYSISASLYYLTISTLLGCPISREFSLPQSEKSRYFKEPFDFFHILILISTHAQHIEEILSLNNPKYPENYIIYNIKKI